MKKYLKAFIPYGLIWLRQIYFKRISSRKYSAQNEERNKKVNDLLVAYLANKKNGLLDNDLTENYYESIILRLVSLGIPEFQVRGGSIPFSSLNYISNLLQQNYSGKKVVLLHIGNFLGVSLTYLTKSAVLCTNSESLVVSIDPNLVHRGVDNPQRYVTYLLSQDGLDKNSLLICGYSLDKSMSNDGELYSSDYDPLEKFYFEFAPINVLKNLKSIGDKYVDVVIIDGNHDVGYLESEINQIDTLLAPGAFIILDDIDPVSWKNLFKFYQSISQDKYINYFQDNRIGVLKIKN